MLSDCLIKVLYAHRLSFRTLVRKYDCDLCYTPMLKLKKEKIHGAVGQGTVAIK